MSSLLPNSDLKDVISYHMEERIRYYSPFTQDMVLPVLEQQQSGHQKYIDMNNKRQCIYPNCLQAGRWFAKLYNLQRHIKVVHTKEARREDNERAREARIKNGTSKKGVAKATGKTRRKCRRQEA